MKSTLPQDRGFLVLVRMVVMIRGGRALKFKYFHS